MSNREKALIKLSVAAQTLHDTCIKTVWASDAKSTFWNNVLERDIMRVVECVLSLSTMGERGANNVVD